MAVKVYSCYDAFTAARVFQCRCMSDLSGGGLGTTLRILIWRDLLCLPIFIHGELTGWARLWNKFHVRGLRITGEMWP